MGTEKLDLTGRRCVILGGGEILDYRAVAGRMRGEDFVICADSGYDHCEALSATPGLLVGDFDSVRSALPADVARVPFPAEKNYTDLTHAIQLAVEAGCGEMLLAGVLGGRLDHTIAAMQDLYSLCRRGVRACFTDGRTDVYGITDGEIRLERRADCYFSVFSLSERSTGVYIRGARYPLVDYTLYADKPRGVSNEFLEGAATVSVARGTLCVLCVPREPIGPSGSRDNQR